MNYIILNGEQYKTNAVFLNDVDSRGASRKQMKIIFEDKDIFDNVYDLYKHPEYLKEIKIIENNESSWIYIDFVLPDSFGIELVDGVERVVLKLSQLNAVEKKLYDLVDKQENDVLMLEMAIAELCESVVM